jgi:hypothetical protein
VKRKPFRVRKVDEFGNESYPTEERIYFDFNDFKLARQLEQDMFAWLD